MVVKELEQCVQGEFLQKTLDSLRSHIAVLNEEGIILKINAPWKRFASDNGLGEQFCGPGVNYLHVCDRAAGEHSEEAVQVAQAIRSVISKRLAYFYLEYPCHSPYEQRWFSIRVTRFEIDDSVCAVVTHDLITQRKLAESKVLEFTRLLELQAATDGLTGIANRRSFDSTLEQAWQRHARNQLPLSLAMLDVDCFKEYNDDQGHVVGDVCLKAIAEAIQSKMRRPGDSVARYGGDEFAVVLSNTSPAGAATIMQDVLRSVRELAIPHPSSEVARGIVTVSMGCATVIPGDRDSPSTFLHRADQALYKAKAQGRDQWKYRRAE